MRPAAWRRVDNMGDRAMRNRGNRLPFVQIVSLVLVCGCASGQQDSPALDPAPNEKCFALKPLDRPPITDRSAMCRALEDNLNEYCGGPSPMCGLSFSENHQEFRLPAWTSLDISENVGLLESMVRGRAYANEIRNRGSAGYQWSLVEEALRDPARDAARLAVAQIDIMNRGVPERVYEFWPNSCDATIGPAASAQILLERHAQIMSDPEMLAAANKAEMSFPGQAALAGALGNVFLHDGTTFLFLWGGLDPYVVEISADRFENVGGVAVCSFDYQPNNSR